MAVVYGHRTSLARNNFKVWGNGGLYFCDDGLLDIRKCLQIDPPSCYNNVLIYLLCQLTDEIVDAGGLDRLFSTQSFEKIHPNGSAQSEKTEQTARWGGFLRQLDTWYESLPPEFIAHSRIKSKIQRPFSDVEILHPHESIHPFDEIRYDSEMTAAMMMQYHMARILLMYGSPNQYSHHLFRIGDMETLGGELIEPVVHHCYEIWSVNLATLIRSLY